MIFKIVWLIAWYQLRQHDLLSRNQCGDLAEAQACFTGLNLFCLTSVVK